MAGVYILTTEGPVRIQRITPEDPIVQSVICLDGRAQALPVSAAYEAFVRRPTGVIEAMTGHGAYRMDVAGPVDEGQSWQMAALIAHVADATSGPPVTVYATGEVDRDLNVRPVSQIARKLARLAESLADHPVEGPGKRPLGGVVLVPAGAADVPTDVAGMTVRPVATVADALAAAGLSLPAGPSSEPAVPDPGEPTSRFGWLKLLLGIATLAVVLMALVIAPARWSGLAKDGRLLELETTLSDAEGGFAGVQAQVYGWWLSLGRPDVGAIRFEAQATLADNVAACAGPGTKTEPAGAAYDGPGVVCAINVRGFVADPNIQLIGRLAYWPDGPGQGRAARTMRGSARVAGREWVLSFDEYPPPGSVLRLAAIAGPVEPSGPQPWYRDLLGAPVDSAAFAGAKARLARLGYAVKTWEWDRR